MNKRLLFTIIAISLVCAFFAWADEPVREDLGYTTNEIVPYSSETEATAPTSESVNTRLDPRLIEIDRVFSVRMTQLEEAIQTAADYSEKMTFQKQVEALKLEWLIATTEVQLEIARESEDLETIASIEECLQNLQSPPERTHTVVQRDPETGEVLEGGAR